MPLRDRNEIPVRHPPWKYDLPRNQLRLTQRVFQIIEIMSIDLLHQPMFKLRRTNAKEKTNRKRKEGFIKGRFRITRQV